MAFLNPGFYWAQVSAKEMELLAQRRIMRANYRIMVENSRRYIPPTAPPNPGPFPAVSARSASHGRTACRANLEAHTTFIEVKAQMATNCDQCGDNNLTLLCCIDCPCQLCPPCWDRNQGGTHHAERPYAGEEPRPGQPGEESESQNMGITNDTRSEVTHRHVGIHQQVPVNDNRGRQIVDLTMDIN
jgi:hypothetical protein